MTNTSTINNINNISYKLDTNKIAIPLLEKLYVRINRIKSHRKPNLFGILASDDYESIQYSKNIQNICKKVGINFEVEKVHKLNVESYIKWANNDLDIDGIIIFYPIFGEIEHIDGGTMDDYLKELVNYKKDVEGLSHHYRFNLYHNIKSNHYYTPLHNIAPSTALAIIKCLEYLNFYDNFYMLSNKLHGITATIVNRSNIVGKPTSLLLANDGAEVYSADKNSIFLMRKEEVGKIYTTEKTIEEACQISNIVILGVSNNNYKLNTKNIKKNTVVINVSTYKNINENELLDIEGVKYIDSIGKITIIMLLYNLLSLYEQFQE